MFHLYNLLSNFEKSFYSVSIALVRHLLLKSAIHTMDFNPAKAETVCSIYDHFPRSA